MLYRLVRTYLTPYAVLLAVLLALQLVATLASLYLPSLNGRIIDEGVAVGDTQFILRTGVVMLVVSFVQILATIGATRIGAQTSASLGRDVRSSVFHRVGQFSAQELSRFGAPTLISRSTNDVTQVQTVTYMFLAIMVSAPIMMVGGIFMALREDLGLAWLVAVAVPALGIAIGLIISRMVPHFRSMQTAVDSVNRILREQITGLRVVRAFVREDVERERFAVANRTYTGTALAVGKLMALAFPVVMVIFNASTVAVLWFGAHRIDNGADGDRRAHGVHVLPDPDPDVGDDGDLHGDDDPAGHRLGRAHPGGARHRVLGARAGRPGRHPARPGRRSSCAA